MEKAVIAAPPGAVASPYRSVDLEPPEAAGIPGQLLKPLLLHRLEPPTQGSGDVGCGGNKSTSL